MTISVIGKVSAPEGLELEAISTERGVETQRTRHKDGDSVSLSVYGSKTIILREVPAGSELEPQPGEQRHGELDQAKLEEGDLDPALAGLLEAEEAASDRVLDLAYQLIDTMIDGDGDKLQAVYQDLRQAVRAHVVAVHDLDVYQSGQAE